jgi:eukaryotic-like serine/threonine-protein kinase
VRPVKWERLKRILTAAVPRRFGAIKASGVNLRSGKSQSTAQADNLCSGSRSIRNPGDAPTLALVRAGPESRKSHSLKCGETVSGRFSILRFISSGGMGEVFEAWDSELGERVALKTIRPEIASFSSAIDRFKQEVRQARGISHVNVCRVYEVFSDVRESGERIWFLTMELLEGQTLMDRIRNQGPIPSEEALGLVEQMVAGLAAAHERGVVHRDFKSSNVILVDSPSGKTRAAVTDFGLAHNVLIGHHIDAEESKEGTPRYMSPEQIKGLAVGFPADQYALGVVMCEMLTGESPIRPDPASGRDKALLPRGSRLDARWETVIRRCLEFRPEDRFRGIRDVATALKPVRRSRAAWVMGIATAVLLISLAVRAGRSGDRVEAATQLTPDTDLTSRPSLSSNGTMIAYSSDRAESGNLDIWVQHLPSGAPRRLTANPAEDVDPNISPDGSTIVFHSERDGGGIYIIRAAGGAEHLLARYGRNPRFSPDGRTIAYWVGDTDTTIASGQLYLLSLANGHTTPLAADFRDARVPVWSSDGRYILFTGCRSREQPMPACSEWWVTTPDGSKVKNTGAVARLRQAQLELVDLIGAWYDGTVLFSGRQGSTTSLWEVNVPESSLRVQGKPRQLTTGEAREVAPSLAKDGNIAFEHFTAALHIWRIDGASNPAKALVRKVTQDPTIDISPSISSDGRWLVFARGYASRRNIWIKDMLSGAESIFFSAPGDKLSPIVDNAGRTIVLELRGEDFPTLVAVTRDQAPRQLRRGCSNPTGWFDGDRAVFCREGEPSRIEMVDVATGAARTVLQRKGYYVGEATWSAENQYLLFTASRDRIHKQIFATLFPKSSSIVSGDWIPLTSESEFSDRPRWSGDGKAIFYLSRRDGFSCVWGQHFDADSGRRIADSFPVLHYHTARFSPHVVVDRSFNLSVAGDSVYLNVGEINTSVWVGHLKRCGVFSFLQASR